ncbi:hypothetical protein CALK_1800 [Chitinivibrio alkaliphilus ACht1]|uniref:Uncharacterized protein n=1 Tax=Chitinivibrio alkaliphilus ACht1 TaxID=1313304 RepID=U7D6W6_9BACT|nr:hypothetical protein CALK_1800 [Chitinivibrio alkaliphilus ACht1]
MKRFLKYGNKENKRKFLLPVSFISGQLLIILLLMFLIQMETFWPGALLVKQGLRVHVRVQPLLLVLPQKKCLKQRFTRE